MANVASLTLPASTPFSLSSKPACNDRLVQKTLPPDAQRLSDAPVCGTFCRIVDLGGMLSVCLPILINDILSYDLRYRDLDQSCVCIRVASCRPDFLNNTSIGI
ncbi:hypothetical protein VTN96DRAFT_1123 [Rasamsonia emersonii]